MNIMSKLDISILSLGILLAIGFGIYSLLRTHSLTHSLTHSVSLGILLLGIGFGIYQFKNKVIKNDLNYYERTSPEEHDALDTAAKNHKLHSTV